MHENGLVARQKRRFKRTTDSEHAWPVAPNLLDQMFEADAPDQKWGVDISYIWTTEGWLYLSIVLDLFSRRVVGWTTSDRLHRALALSALRKALAMRQPAAGLIHHSDRGSQGVFNRSSQHWVIGQILGIRSRLQLVSSNQAFSGACCSARELRHGSLGRSSATGRCPSGSIAAKGRWCSRSCRAAMDCGELRRRPSPRTRS